MLEMISAKMENQYKLTVSVLTYNRSHYLTKMLDSIIQQTYQDFYVKIYDNGSTDNTEEVVQPYLQDSRFSYHKFQQNSLTNGRMPFNQCDTEYFIWAHDDDIMLPDMIKEELFILENNNDIGLVTVNSNYIDEQDIIFKYSIYDHMSANDLVIQRQDYFNLFIKGKCIICCPAVMYRMSIIRGHNIFLHYEYGGACDVFQWMEINQYCNIYYISKTLFNYRKHKNQDSQNTLVLDPLLKKPILGLLDNYDNPVVHKEKWLKYINKRIFHELFKSKDVLTAYKTIKHAMFLPGAEFLFRLKVYFLVFFPFSKLQIRVYRKLKKFYASNSELIRIGDFTKGVIWQLY
jgi:glycosyltransferase involved in cell wall biosynthesis